MKREQMTRIKRINERLKMRRKIVNKSEFLFFKEKMKEGKHVWWFKSIKFPV